MLFPVVPDDSIKGNENKMKCRRFCLKVRKHFFAVRLTEFWNRLPKNVESPFSDNFKISLGPR